MARYQARFAFFNAVISEPTCTFSATPQVAVERGRPCDTCWYSRAWTA